MNLPVKDMLYGLLDAPPHPAPVAAVDRRLQRGNRVRLAAVATAVAAVTVAGLTIHYPVGGPGLSQERFAHSSVGPELGTVPTPDPYKEQAGSQGPVPDRLDLLARYSASGITFFVAGHFGNGKFCYTLYDDQMEAAGGGGITCGPWPFQRPAGAPSPDPTKFFLNRGYSSGRGPATNTVSGTVPRGTRTVVLRTPAREQRIPVFDSGDAWDHLGFFNAPIDAPRASAVALDDGGQVLATANEP